MAHSEVAEKLRDDTVFYARHCLKIVNKERQTVPLIASEGQRVLDRMLEEQRAAGKPMRAIALKARQVGVSTWMQGKLIQRATQRENYEVVVLAHDTKTGEKLWKIGKKMYDNLPDDISLKPEKAHSRRGKEMHFLNGWRKGGEFPDSTYMVDTAGESDSGRGGTYMGIHGSEVAFWDDLTSKIASLLNAVPDSPESLVVLESTANGHNAFKRLWDRAMQGDSEFLPFFWPWWKEPQYQLAFANEQEKARFRVGDTSQSPYADGELELFDPGPPDHLTNKRVPLTLEQLNWRRAKKATNEELFQQEYPATPEEAFIASTRQVFDPNQVRSLLISTSLTDPRNPTPDHQGPARGILKIGSSVKRSIGTNTVEVPTEPLWLPSEKLTLGQMTDWKIWGDPTPRTEGQYVIGVDVSGGEIEDDRAEPAYHAIEVIDHITREQVAEYRSRVDSDLLAEQVYLAALFFNRPWVGIEITGNHGLPVIRRMWTDGYRYNFLFFRNNPQSKGQKRSDRLGWDTNRTTKPMMEALTAQLLRKEETGIKSYALAMELATYIRMPNGKSRPENGKFSDRLMAWQIAQQIAQQQPLKKQTSSSFNPRPVRNTATGW